MQPSLRIEVTFIDSYEGALRRELLLQAKSAPGAGRIYRDRKTGQIIATSELGPSDEEIEGLASAILERFNESDLSSIARERCS